MGGAGSGGRAGVAGSEAGSAAGGATTSSAGGMGNAGGAAIGEAGASAGNAAGASGAGTGRTCLGPNIDLVAPVVSGKLTVNGVALPSTNDGDGEVVFSNEAGDYATLGALAASSYSAHVASGTYDLYYSAFNAPGLPSGGVKLQSDVIVGTSPLTLDIDLPTTAVSTTLTLNGSPPPDDGSNSDGGAFLELRRGTDAKLWLAYMVSPVQSTVAVPGTYDVYYSVYSRMSGGIPTNTSGKVKSGVVIDGSDASLKIDIPATPVSVSVTVAGAAITGATPELTYLTLENDDGDTAPLTVTSSSGKSSALVIPGTYDLYYGVYGETCVPPYDCNVLDAFAPNVPLNASVKVKSGVVVGSSPVSLAIDLPAVRVAGTVTVNGAGVDGLNGAGLLTLTSADGDSVALSPDATGAYSALVLPGTYDLVYGINGRANQNGASVLPNNFDTKLRSGIVVGTSPLTLDIDIPTTTVSGNITLNGVPLPPAGKGDGDGYVALTTADGAWVSLGSLRDGSFSTLVIAGTYDLAYSAKIDPSTSLVGPGVPVNSSVFERGVVVGTSPQSLAIDVPAVNVSGVVTANGVAVTDSKTAGAGALTLVAPDGSATRFATVPSSSADASLAAIGGYSELLIPGSYELYYQDYFNGASVPGNEHVHLGCFDVRR